MSPIKNFRELTERVKQHPARRRVAVVCPYDSHTIEAITPALADGDLMHFTLVGDKQQILSVLPPQYLPRVEIVDTGSDSDMAALRAVEMAHDGSVDIVMKGLLNTDNFLKAILNKECGLLPPGRTLTHLTVAEIPTYHKLLFFSDVAVIPYPTLEQRIAMIGYDAHTCRRMGIDRPKVALIHFTEKVNPKFPVSVDYVTLCEMAARGDLGNVIVSGPMDVKCACNPESAAIKGIEGPVAGDADLLIFQNIDSGNTFYKTITGFGSAQVAGVLQGTICPVVLASRGDSALSKFYSLALACMNID